ncbi:MAG TPA: DivIVA domain-containing protein [Vicinamibacterales bacterium]|nr:DivIVA domain-containing protein [Vicinamibacterales bacterium]
MNVSPLDLRQQRFRKALRGFDPVEVTSFLAAVADDYEQALRETDRMRQDLARMEVALAHHRDNEQNLRATLMTAQKLSDDIKASAEAEAARIAGGAEAEAARIVGGAEAEARRIVTDADSEARRVILEAGSRSELLLNQTQARFEDIQREIDGLKLKRKDVEITLEASIQALHNTLEFVREQEARERDDRILFHRPRPAEHAEADPHPARKIAG